MGGGHQIHGNEKNFEESDSDMQTKIQRIETIKHNPNNFHLAFFNPTNMFNILGGAQSFAFATAGAGASYLYYAAQSRPYNFYAHNQLVATRLVAGFALGLAFGYVKFGDRQVLHNAWVAERLRRRYPESMELQATDLWRLKGVKATHDFYKWQ